MFALVLLGLVSAASTAPWYDPYEYNHGHEYRMDRFWDNFNKEMDNAMKYTNNQDWSRIEGNEYQIIINMPGFNKEDIKVKAKKGNVVVQANHDVPGEPGNNYLFVRDLPNYVDENGSWSYINDILTIFFTIIQRGSENTRASNLPHYVNNAQENPNVNNIPGVSNYGV